MGGVESNMPKRFFSTVVLCCVCIMISYFSNQPGDISLQVSDKVASSLHIEPENFWETPSQKYIVGLLNFRKLTHIAVYFCLGLCAFVRFRSNILLMVLKKAVLFCFIFSVADEIHQRMIVGRNASITDLLLDACGYCFSIFICAFLFSKRK